MTNVRAVSATRRCEWLEGVLLRVLLTGMCVMPAIAARAQSFTAPANVAGDATAFSPQTVVDGTGNVNVGYLDAGADLSSNSLWFVRGTFSGGSFHASAAPVQVAARAGSSFSMTVEGPCTIDFTYADAFGLQPNNVFFAQSTDCGVTFQATNVTNNLSGFPNAANPRLVINGAPTVVWTAQPSPTSFSSTIFFAQRQASSGFSAPTALATSTNGVGCFQAVALAGGSTGVGWCDVSGGTGGSIWFVNAAAGAQPVKIGTGDLAQFAADAAGNVYAFWDDPKYNSIWFSRSSASGGASGGAFMAPKMLFPVSGPTETAPQIAADNTGNISLLRALEQRVTLANGNSVDTIQFSVSRSTDGGNNFSSPASIVTESCGLCGSGVPAQMALDAQGNADVAWEALGGWNPAGFLFSRSNVPGSSFSAPVAVAANASPKDVAITTDASNRVFVSWTANGAFISQGSAANDVSVTVQPAILTALPGGTAQSQETVTAADGFDQSVTLGCSNLPSGAACAFSSDSVVPTASGTIVTLTLTIPPTLPAGGFPFTLNITSPFITQAQQLQATVGLMSGSVAPTAATIPAGGAASFAVTMIGTSGASGQFDLACNAPTGVACTFTPSKISVSVNGTATSTLSLQVVNVPVAAMAPKVPSDEGPWVGMAAVALFVLAIPMFVLARRSTGGLGAPVHAMRAMAATACVVAISLTVFSCGGATTTKFAVGTSGAASAGGAALNPGTSSGTPTVGTTTTTPGSSTTPAGSVSVTFPVGVVAVSGPAVVNVGTVTVTVP